MGGYALILLDTHVLVWLVLEPQRLSRPAGAAIRRARNQGLAIAGVSLFELAMLFSRGRLGIMGTVENSVRTVVDASGVSVIPITAAIAVLGAQLPREFPGDPVDRIIAATACAENWRLVTADERIRSSARVQTVW